MNVHKSGLCTAKELIHPQCPQGYPQIHRGKSADFPAIHHGYPQYPQVIHKRYPQRFSMWIFMWTCTFALFILFTNVTELNINACSCMLGKCALQNQVVNKARSYSTKCFGSNKSVKSPKNLWRRKVVHTTKKAAPSSATPKITCSCCCHGWLHPAWQPAS